MGLEGGEADPLALDIIQRQANQEIHPTPPTALVMEQEKPRFTRAEKGKKIEAEQGQG